MKRRLLCFFRLHVWRQWFLYDGNRYVEYDECRHCPARREVRR